MNEDVTGWMTPIIHYLIHRTLHEDANEARRVKKVSVCYLIMADKLYKMGRSVLMLRCISKGETMLVMKEVYEGACGSHIGGRALSGKNLKVGYYWPRMLQDYA